MPKVLSSLVLALVAVSAVFASPAAADDAGDEAAFLASLNGLRSSKGLGTLVVDNDLTAVARAWSATMAAAGTISHNSSLAGQSPPDWVALGENVGVGRDVQGLHAAFVASPTHYKNMVDGSFDSVGIGVVRDGAGRIFVTVDFMKSGAAAPATVEAAARPAPAHAPAPVAAPAPAPAPPPAPAPVAAPRPAQAAASAPLEPVAEPVPAPSPAPDPAAAPEPAAASVAVPVTSPAGRRVMVTSQASASADSSGIVLVLVGLLLTVAASVLVIPRMADRAPARARR